ncbi:MAG: hypothetical protein JWO42_4008 [Chloroflexi bacterium]|nr:hypothetical protein [Chloroflexota bacterium]
MRLDLRASALAIDIEAMRARVVADLPWHAETSAAGTLRITQGALVLEPQVAARGRVVIPVATITRSSFESAWGMLPALHVWHTVRGEEVLSRFEFSPTAGDARRSTDTGPGISDQIGPGVARDAAQKLEGGLRALGGGLNMGMRTARQAVDGIARQEEYRLWPTALQQAKAQSESSGSRQASPQTPSSRQPSPRPAEESTSVVPPDAARPSGDAAVLLPWFLQQVVAWLTECGQRAKQQGVRGVPVIQPLYPLDSPVCRIVVLGEFSRGKSTLINALFGIHGEIALPTGMTPTTPIACAIRVPRIGETDGATISYRTNRPDLELSLEDFRTGVRVTEELNEASKAGSSGGDLHLDEARRVEVRVTGAYLPSGVEIEDTPGLNEQAGRSAGALAALGRADLVLFVLAADQLLGDLERDVIDQTLTDGFHRNVLFLVNFWDTIDNDQWRDTLQSRADAVLKGFPTPFKASGAADTGNVLPHVFYVSALQAARAQRRRQATPEESGIPQLRATLRELLGPESSALLLRSRVGRALRYTGMLRRAISKAAAEDAIADTSRGQVAAIPQLEAANGAIRILEGLPGAISGATSPRLAALEGGPAPRLNGIVAELERAAERSGGTVAPDLRRTASAELRTIATELAETAQQAVDLLIAQARATFLGKGIAPPSLEAMVVPLTFPIPAEATAGELRTLLLGAADLLRTDLAEKGTRLSVALTDGMRAQGRRIAHEEPRPTRPEQDGEAARRRLASLRQLEDDLLRIERLLRPLLDK